MEIRSKGHVKLEEDTQKVMREKKRKEHMKGERINHRKKKLKIKRR